MPWYPERKPKTTGRVLKTYLVGEEQKTLEQIAEMAEATVDKTRKALFHFGMSPDRFIEMEKENNGRKKES